MTYIVDLESNWLSANLTKDIFIAINWLWLEDLLRLRFYSGIIPSGIYSIYEEDGGYALVKWCNNID